MLKMVRHFVFADPLVEKVFDSSTLLLREEDINNELKKNINSEPEKKRSFKISRNTEKNKIKMGVFNIPHPDKILKGGEDAFCVREGLMVTCREDWFSNQRLMKELGYVVTDSKD